MVIEEKALIYDEAGDKLSVSTDEAAVRDLYARVLMAESDCLRRVAACHPGSDARGGGRVTVEKPAKKMRAVWS
jgi:hypothetical protein